MFNLAFVTRMSLTLLLALGLLTQPALAKSTKHLRDTGVSTKHKDGSWEAHRNLIADVSARARVDAGTMAAFAAIESNFKARSKNRGSSASGLYAFTAPTWKTTVKRYGPKYGIRPGTSRLNPRANALMAAEYIKENQRYLESQLHRRVSSSEVYLAHLMGPGGAVQLLKARPSRYASTVAPSTARSNKRLFYTTRGKPRTVAQFRAFIEAMVTKQKQTYGTEARLMAAAINHDDPIALIATNDLPGQRPGA